MILLRLLVMEQLLRVSGSLINPYHAREKDWGSSLPSILHVTHTDVFADPRVLRSIHAGIAGGFEVQAVGVNQGKQSINSYEASHDGSISLLCPPKVLQRRRSRTSPHWDTPGYLEVADGRRSVLRRLAFSLWLTFKILNEVRSKQPDIIHVHDFVMLPVSCLAAQLVNAKVVYDAHELESEKAGCGRLQRQFTRSLERIVWPKVNGFVTVSKSIQDWYFKEYEPRKGCVVLNAPLTSHRGTHELSLRTRLGASDSELIFVYVGALEYGRGLEKLVRVFSNSGLEAKLVLIGDGTRRQEFMAQSDGAHNVIFMPPVRHDQLTTVLQDADYGLSLIENVSLSDYFSLPNKLLEYINSGMRVVVSDTPDQARLVTTNAFGHVVGENDEDLENLLRHLSSSGRPSRIDPDVVTPFTWAVQEALLIGLYGEVFESQEPTV